MADGSWEYHPDLPEIPYLVMTGTDSDSNVTYVDTVYPNIIGHSTYDSKYDYYTIGYDGVSNPVSVVLDPGVALGYKLFKFDTNLLEVSITTGESILSVESPYVVFEFLTVVMYSGAAELSWLIAGTATTYTVKSIQDAGTEKTVGSSSEETLILYDIDPGSTYDFNIYADSNLVATLTSPGNLAPVADSVSTSSLLTFLGNDLTLLLSSSAISGTDTYLRDVLTTGDTIQSGIVLPGGAIFSTEVRFVKDSESITIDNSIPILLPFLLGGSAGQNVDLTLTDGTTQVNTIYDEGTNGITLESNARVVGDVFILDGKKVTVAETN